MYKGQVGFGDLSAIESVTAAIEFARIADMYGVTGMEARMAEHIKALINASSPPWDDKPDSNVYLIESKHIASAVHLPQRHPVREILAAASVKGFFVQDEHKFSNEAKEVPGFSSDLLMAVKSALKTLRKEDYKAWIIDPIDGLKIRV